MYSDFHVHTAFSSDSEAAPEAQLEKAVSLGMKEICFTDHQDLDFPPGELDFLLDTPAYVPAVQQLQNAWEGRIQLRLGVELGLQPHLGSRLPEYVDAYPFDFVIGSTHVSRRLDPYEPAFFQGIAEEDAYRLYFEEELENLRKYDCFDVAGHIDYVLRYGAHGGDRDPLDAYGDVLDEILRTLIDKGKGLECNTAGLRSRCGVTNPSPSVLLRYREMGGEILTLGSDAHDPKDLGSRFPELRDLLAACGFRYYTVFRERKPYFLPL